MTARWPPWPPLDRSGAPKRRQLNHITHLGHWGGLLGFVHIGNHRHSKGAFYLGEDAQALIQARASVGVDRGAIGLIKGGLKDVGNAQFCVTVT